MKKYFLSSLILTLLFLASRNVFAGENGRRYPGGSIASQLLQRDATMSVFAAVSVKIKNCTDLSVTDTKLEKMPEFNKIYNGQRYASSPWEEVWTVNACGKDVYVPVTFIPDDNGTGTSFAVSPNDIRLK